VSDGGGPCAAPKAEPYPIIHVRCLYEVSLPDGTVVGTYPGFLSAAGGPPYVLTMPDGQVVTCRSYALYCRGVGPVARTGPAKVTTFERGKIRRSEGEMPEPALPLQGELEGLG
jgi:hypothetical protein